MIELKTTYGDIYRITYNEAVKIPGQTRADRRWLPQIPCKYGHVYVHGRETLGAYVTGRLITGRLAALPGVRVLQQGDEEVAVSFPPEMFPAVASLLQARKIRQVSAAQAAAGAKRLAEFRRTKAAGKPQRVEATIEAGVVG